MDRIAYVYKWTHLPSFMWYIGSRTAKGCHPNDDYICSSPFVKGLIVSDKHLWVRQIIATGVKEDMKQLEDMILQLVDAAGDTKSFNRSNNDGKRSGCGRKPGHRVSDKARANYLRANRKKAKDPIECAKFARPRTPEWKATISKALTGLKRGPMSEEHKKLRSEANKRSWANKIQKEQQQ